MKSAVEQALAVAASSLQEGVVLRTSCGFTTNLAVVAFVDLGGDCSRRNVGPVRSTVYCQAAAATLVPSTGSTPWTSKRRVPPVRPVYVFGLVHEANAG